MGDATDAKKLAEEAKLRFGAERERMEAELEKLRSQVAEPAPCLRYIAPSHRTVTSCRYVTLSFHTSVCAQVGELSAEGDKLKERLQAKEDEAKRLAANLQSETAAHAETAKALAEAQRRLEVTSEQLKLLQLEREGDASKLKHFDVGKALAVEQVAVTSRRYIAPLYRAVISRRCVAPLRRAVASRRYVAPSRGQGARCGADGRYAAPLRLAVTSRRHTVP